MRANDRVKDWMTEEVVTIARDRPVVEAYSLMIAHDIRHLPVVEGGRLAGMLSSRDLQRFAPGADASAPKLVESLADTKVSEIAKLGKVVTIDPGATLAAAAQALFVAKVGAVPVLEEGRLVGILTTTDLLRALFARPRERTALSTEWGE